MLPSWLPLADVPAFHVAIVGTLLVSGGLLALLGWMFRSPRFDAWHIRKTLKPRITRANYLRVTGTTVVLSSASTLGLIYGLAPFALSAAPWPWWWIAVQGFLVLFVYDFAYYFAHRLMHVKRLMPLVHEVHHRIRTPSALEALYLSPAEMFLGLGLLMVVVWVVGPVHWAAFAVVFFIYSTLHIVIHSGMLFPHPVFRVTNYLTLKHHKHHLNKHGHNYASVTPLPDIVFGTAT